MEDKSPNKYMRYIGAGMQMLITIFAGVMIGRWLDGHFQTTTPWYSIGCSLLFIFAAMYLLIKSLPNE
ncbi:MAG: AtpZ/AtpI family protein [Spirosomataceae bacterium]|jgi:F0F1-type ATP synthase assembly protein I